MVAACLARIPQEHRNLSGKEFRTAIALVDVSDIFFFSVRGRGKGRKRLSRWWGGVRFFTENIGRGGGYLRRRGRGGTGAARISARRGRGLNFFFGAEMPTK